jgi:hypothetical protein
MTRGPGAGYPAGGHRRRVSLPGVTGYRQANEQESAVERPERSGLIPHLKLDELLGELQGGCRRSWTPGNG